MEKPFKIVIFILGAVLYCTASGGFSKIPNNYEQHVLTTETAQTRPSFSTELPFVNSFAVKEGNLSLVFIKTAPETSQKKEAYKAAMHAAEVKVSCAVINYNSLLSHFPVRIRKSDMLFPFHYFFETVLI